LRGREEVVGEKNRGGALTEKMPYGRYQRKGKKREAHEGSKGIRGPAVKRREIKDGASKTFPIGKEGKKKGKSGKDTG